MTFLENKIPPPIVFLVTAIAMWLVASQTEVTLLPAELRWSAIAGLLAVGLLTGPPAILAFSRANTTINPVDIEKASSLVTAGPFAFTRNPMYVMMLAFLLAWSTYLSAAWVWLGPVVFALYINRLQIIPEERVMRAKFGAAYEAYTRKVRRWV